jgi:hypothetical protein
MTHGTKTFAATVPVGDRDRIRLWHVEVTIELDNLLKTAAHAIARNKSRKSRMVGGLITATGRSIDPREIK